MEQTTDGPARRLLFVHAHPDDETITTGATIAHYAALGDGVTVLTCTLGEQGEILVPEFSGLEASQADQLGGLRIGELAAAMRALGVRDHRYLGGAGRFRDSGMMDSEANRHPRAFWRADTEAGVFAAAVAAAVEVIRDVRPQVVVTYDDNGDYGHPDHIMAHRVTTAAVAAAADPGHAGSAPWAVAKLYWTATPVSAIGAGFQAVAQRPEAGFDIVDIDQLPFGVADDVVSTTLRAEGQVAAKTAALAAHATQVLVDGHLFALSNRIGREISGVEHYRLAQGASGPVDGDGREHDLFAGVAP